MDLDSLPAVARAFVAAVSGDDGIEREVLEDSSLGREIASADHLRSHFLSELPHHCTMLIVAIADAYASLLSLGPGRPFSSNAVARGLLECAADLYWLGDCAIDPDERARRAITVYLTQTESTIRQLEQLQKRTEDSSLDQVISEGWSLLQATAEQANNAGYPVRSTRRAGQRYVLGTGKPAMSALVDDVVSEFVGRTGVNLYSRMSSTAHAEGSGLGQLLDHASQKVTTSGPRFACGMEFKGWAHRHMHPCHAVAVGATMEWLGLAFPKHLPGFASAVGVRTGHGVG